MKGFKMFLWAALMAAVPGLSAWLGGVDWVATLTSFGVPQFYVVPLAGIIGGIVTAGLRMVTTTAPFQKS